MGGVASFREIPRDLHIRILLNDTRTLDRALAIVKLDISLLSLTSLISSGTPDTDGTRADENAHVDKCTL